MGKRKILIGEVVSDKMQKTVVVKVQTIKKHPKYRKVVKQYKKFKAHDEKGIAKIGDTVSIEETKPISKDKHFRVTGVVRKAALLHVEIKEEVK